MRGDQLWLGLALGCLAIGNILRATPFGDPAAGLLSAATISIIAATVVLYGSIRHLTHLLRGMGTERLRLRVALEEQEAGREERLHDVRSTLAAIRCAAGTLHRYDGKLASTQRATLQSAVTSELVRLGRLIDPVDQAEVRPFELGPALAGVVETERALGSEIHVQLENVVAVGRSDDTAEIVQNLLVNARRYAAGTPITLCAQVSRRYVEVLIQDEGPGLSMEDRATVFGRGRRGAAKDQAPGSGLGLFVARRLAVEQGGDLVVTDRPGGGACFVLRLPSVTSQQDLDQLGDVGDGSHAYGAGLPPG
jgi:signal transduction histidine kinase